MGPALYYCYYSLSTATSIIYYHYYSLPRATSIYYYYSLSRATSIIIVIIACPELHLLLLLLFLVQSYIPDPFKLRGFVSTPPPGNERLFCTMIRHGDETSGGHYTLYLEYLSGLVPLLKGKRASKLRPDFVIFDPKIRTSGKGEETGQKECCGLCVPELWTSGKDKETVLGKTKECCGLCEPGIRTSGMPRNRIRTSGKDQETGLVVSEECCGVYVFF